MGDTLQAIKNPRDFPCPYRAGQLRNVFLIHALPAFGLTSRNDIIKDTMVLHDHFLPKGLSSGTLHVNGNDCKSCQACVPLRIRTSDYSFSRNEKSILKNNKDLHFVTKPVEINFEHHALFIKYLNSRHPENDNNNWVLEDVRNQLVPHTDMIEMRTKGGALVGVAILDVLSESLNAFQFFYDPDFSDNKRSLGTLCYLKIIELAKARQREHIYIGSWVSDSPKLDYKKRFQNLEALSHTEWVTFNPAIHVNGPNLIKSVPPETPWVVAP